MMEQSFFPSFKFLISSSVRCSLIILTSAPGVALVPEASKDCPALWLEADERLFAATRAFFFGHASADMNEQWQGLTAARTSNLKLCNRNDATDKTNNY